MITRGTILGLGLSQLICWGITCYLIGGFGDLIATDFGWSRSLVHGGFSVVLKVRFGGGGTGSSILDAPSQSA